MLNKITLLIFLITSISFSQITFQKIYGGVEEEECDAVEQTEVEIILLIYLLYPTELRLLYNSCNMAYLGSSGR